MPPNLIQITSRVVALARSNRIKCARKLFDETPHKDSIAWNAMLTSYSHLGHHREAISLFYTMRMENTKPDHFSFTSILNACAGISDLRNGAKIHSLIILSGYISSLPVNNSLIDMYGKCLDPFSGSKVFKDMIIRNEVTWCSLLFAYVNSGMFNNAHELFMVMPKKVEFSWNIMISGLARYGEVEHCLNLFKDMQQSSFSPDHCTFSALMSVCACSQTLNNLLYGSMVHACIVKTGWDTAAEAKNSILSFYAKVGCQTDVSNAFLSIQIPNHVSWNAIIDAYMKTGDTHKAYEAFCRAPEKDVVSWTSMIAGLSRNGDGEQSLVFFTDMWKTTVVRPDDFTYGAVLHACSSFAVIFHGRMVHSCLIRHGYQAYAYVGNGLVNMYAKCGDIEGSRSAFRNIVDKDLVSWNAMLFGYGMHGLASEALLLYEDMVATGVKPDKVTFVGLLTTCSHNGLIEKGRLLFETMKTVYGFSYDVDHVVCMVDMYGRGGFLEEAAELVKTYAGTESCEALLGHCSAKGDLGLATEVVEGLTAVNGEVDMGYYVVLSNLYCVKGRWKEAEVVRKRMAGNGVKKTPGCSWIEIRNEVTSFSAGNNSHVFMDELSEILCYLEFEMRIPSLSGFFV